MLANAASLGLGFCCFCFSLQVVKHLSAQHCPTTVGTCSGWHWEPSQTPEGPQPSWAGELTRVGVGREADLQGHWLGPVLWPRAGSWELEAEDLGGWNALPVTTPTPLPPVTVDCEC